MSYARAVARRARKQRLLEEVAIHPRTQRELSELLRLTGEIVGSILGELLLEDRVAVETPPGTFVSFWGPKKPRAWDGQEWTE